MSTGAIIGIIVAVIVVVGVIVVASGELRRARMRRQFGPEYDRLAKELGSKKKADAELTARQRRVEALNIHDLSAEQQASYGGDWTAVQERFVDTPAEAVSTASTLIWNVMRDRGYPVDDRRASLEALSVYHAEPLAGYRQVQDIRPENATTEELREAMIRYRALFEDLTGLGNGHGTPERDRVAEIRERSAENNQVTTGDRELLTDDGEVAADGSDRTVETPR
jgi:PAS domain-containing protein